MASRTIYESNTVHIEYFYNEITPAANIAFNFTPARHRELIGNPYGGETILSNGFDVISFKSSVDDWFQAVPLYVFDDINRIVLEKEYIRKVAIGSSMGGYAAIAFSKLLDVESVLAYSPQYSIEEEFDVRWEIHLKDIEFKYRISKDSVKDDCKFVILYDNKHPTDSVHITKLMKIIPEANVQLIKMSYCGHPSLHALHQSAMLKDVLLSFLLNNDINIDMRKKKKKTHSYLTNLAVQLIIHNHLKWAERVVDTLILSNPKFSSSYVLKCIILHTLGKQKESAVFINAAIKFNPNIKYYRQFSGVSPNFDMIATLRDIYIRKDFMPIRRVT